MARAAEDTTARDQKKRLKSPGLKVLKAFEFYKILSFKKTKSFKILKVLEALKF